MYAQEAVVLSLLLSADPLVSELVILVEDTYPYEQVTVIQYLSASELIAAFLASNGYLAPSRGEQIQRRYGIQIALSSPVTPALPATLNGQQQRYGQRRTYWSDQEIIHDFAWIDDERLPVPSDTVCVPIPSSRTLALQEARAEQDGQEPALLLCAIATSRAEPQALSSLPASS